LRGQLSIDANLLHFHSASPQRRPASMPRLSPKRMA
jgi:hypothetical protein